LTPFFLEFAEPPEGFQFSSAVQLLPLSHTAAVVLLQSSKAVMG
jgi:hypothetical protein